MKQDAFFTGAKTWSKRKHRLLAKYLKPFSAKVGSRSKEIYIIDGFAGAAKYGDDYEGSPLVLARIADDCATWQNPVSLKIINIEAKHTHYKSLCEATQSWVERNIVTNRHGQFGALIPEIMFKVGEVPAFFFIDPYGPSPLHFAYLRPILERRQPITELIINFDADGLRRLADDLRAKTSTKVGQKACETIVANVTNILGRDRWRQYFATDRLSAYERERFLVEDYTDSLSHFGYRVVAYPIREVIDQRPKYWLIYCTRHPDGVMLMNGFIRREEDELIRESYERDGQQPLFDPVEKEIQDRRSELKRLVYEYVNRNRRTTRGAIKQHFVEERFAEFHETDYNAIVQEFLNEDLLKAIHGRKKINDNEPLTYTPPREGVIV